jgi:hypothetical protein
MSGELGGEDTPVKPEAARWLQKPFRISDVLNLLAEPSQLRAIFGIFAIIFAAKLCVSIAAL